MKLQTSRFLSRRWFKPLARRCNRPWADGLLLQQRVHAGNLDDYIADMKAASPGLTDEDLYKQFGVRKVTEKVVSLTKN